MDIVDIQLLLQWHCKRSRSSIQSPISGHVHQSINLNSEDTN